jgi:NADP-dependent 3-hydroxy acid dehydrogenase YdfG
MKETRTAFITGGASGIGAATTRRLLAAGQQVAVTGRDESRLKAFADSIGEPSRLLVIPCDAAQHVALAEAVQLTLERFGRIDAAIANAGLSTHDSLATGDPEAWHDMVLINVLGPAILVKAVLPALKETRGRLVFLGSVAGFQHTPGNLYSVTKWAVTALAESTRLMVSSDGIGVTLIAPGRVDTSFWEHAPSGRLPPAGPILTAEHIAETICWALDQPPGVDMNTIVVRPLGQAV